MKKTLILLTASILAVSITPPVLSTEIDLDNPANVAYWAQKHEEARLLSQKALKDDEALKDAIRMGYDVSFGSFSSETLISSMRRSTENITEEGKTSLKRTIKVMESMVCEGLALFKKDESNNLIEEKAQASLDIDCCMLLLAALPDYDIHPLLKECFQSKNEGFRCNMLRNYVKAKDVEAIPFLRELVKEANLTEQNRSNIYWELGNFIERFTRQQRSDDVEKINAFLKEVRYAEQSKMQEQPTPKNDTAKKDEIIIPDDNGANKFSPPAMTNVTDEKGEPSQQTPPIPPEKSSSNKIILLFSIITFLAIIGSVVTWKKP